MPAAEVSRRNAIVGLKSIFIIIISLVWVATSCDNGTKLAAFIRKLTLAIQLRKFCYLISFDAPKFGLAIYRLKQYTPKWHFVPTSYLIGNRMSSSSIWRQLMPARLPSQPLTGKHHLRLWSQIKYLLEIYLMKKYSGDLRECYLVLCTGNFTTFRFFVLEINGFILRQFTRRSGIYSQISRKVYHVYSSFISNFEIISI